METNLDYVLTIQIPGHTQQFHVMCFNMEEARAHIDKAMSTGRIESAADNRLLVLHTIPGTVYFVISKKDHERMMIQARFAAAQAPGGIHQ
jgi:hypothetical protein